MKESRYKVDYKTGKYVAPPLKLLSNYSPDSIFMNSDRLRKLSVIIENTSKALGITAQVIDIKASSFSIAYTIQLAIGESVKNFMKLKADLSLALASEIEINTVDGSKVQLSVKNMNRPLIGLKDILKSDDFIKSKSILTVGAGVDIHGKNLIIDLEEAPHLLIAGTTGSGKSVFIDDILLSILFHSSPDDVRLLLIDPKMVELMPYNGIPHLLMPVISDPNASLSSFLWVEDEILRRFNSFSECGVKSIDAYNKYAEKNGLEKIPRILVVIDEYMDLIMDNPKEINDVIDRFASSGRIVGVHLILATQRPTAKIVTSKIKNNIPCRASFTVVDGRESNLILAETGAQRLLGNGDMIFSQSEASISVHAQAAYVSETELRNVIKFIKDNN